MKKILAYALMSVVLMLVYVVASFLFDWLFDLIGEEKVSWRHKYYFVKLIILYWEFSTTLLHHGEESEYFVPTNDKHNRYPPNRY